MCGERRRTRKRIRGIVGGRRAGKDQRVYGTKRRGVRDTKRKNEEEKGS